MSERGDIIDQANALDAKLTAAYIQQARAQNAALAAHGACHFCSADLPPDLRFCDIECRDDWQKQDAARKRAGQ